MELEIRNLTKEYKQGNRSLTAVSDINLKVKEGDFISIMGKSGSGKSTLLNLIAGILFPTKGEILFDGKDITAFSDMEASGYRNLQIGYVLQGQAPIPSLTVLENVKLPFYLSERKGNPTQEAYQLLDKVGIRELADAYPKELSGGEMKRMSIARALINHPGLLLADEPTGDLDSFHTAEIIKLFQKIAVAGTAVLMVTHEEDASRQGTALYRMDSGKLTQMWKR